MATDLANEALLQRFDALVWELKLSNSSHTKSSWLADILLGVAIGASYYYAPDYIESELIRAQVINSQQTIEAYWHKLVRDTDIATDQGEYYQPDGESLAPVHPDLRKVVSLAAQRAKDDGYDFFIKDSSRTLLEQKANLRNGASKTLNSRHLPDKNGIVYAVDITIPYEGNPSNAKDWEQVRLVNRYMQQAANDLNIDVEWGGNWKGFPDGFHFQLYWEHYPKNKVPASTSIEQSSRSTYPQLTEAVKAALMANIIATESSGNPEIINKDNGRLGYFQAGASSLVEAGFIKKAAYESASSDVKKGIGQAHKAFLGSASNWTIQGGQVAYLRSTDYQSKFYDHYVSTVLKRLTDEQAISASDDQPTLAGAVKAAWFGHTRAIAYLRDARNGIENTGTDGNGTKVSKYFNDGKQAALSVLPKN